MSPSSPPPQQELPLKDVYSVSRLNREVRTILEGSFPLLWIEGEISNLARPASGHWYFSLKDDAAQIRCAMFRNRNRQLGFTPENGMHVLLRARISLYEARGEFQIIAEHMEEAGAGALQRAFEALKRRLDQEGLFATEHKKSLPAKPNCVGIVTSPTGAAVRDILTTLQRRFPALPVIIYPVPVQGEGAAEKIAQAVALANHRKECDVLVVARGGGSLEDLWAFNEERVARAIFDSEIPVVTGVGHEIDFSIADFVADQRAPTPTAAAEMISPDQQEWLQRLNQIERQLESRLRTRLDKQQQTLAWLARQLVHPGRRVQVGMQRVDELEIRLQNAIVNKTRFCNHQIEVQRARLEQLSPALRLEHLITRCNDFARRLQQASRGILKTNRQRVELASRALDAVSPLATLNRGYAIVSEAESGAVVHNAEQVCTGSTVETRLHKGRLHCEVKKIFKD